ncbi:hypothetical protein [Agrococcus sp. DT81.2]|uniref:hypothetical protein n=1 Tax=Agrococcus sp. DT81.2 TaxID=3393414 RepID=UPI003CE511BF
MGDIIGGVPWWVLALVLFAAWVAVCLWAVAKLLRMDVALITKVLWALAILAFPVAGLIAFLLLADRTPQMERELGIRRY